MSKPENITDPRKQFVRLFNELCYSHSRWRVFQDFCEMAAIALRQPFYQDAEAEARYMEIIKVYDPAKADKFAEMLACVVLGLENKTCDFLGSVFHELEMQNENMGQFFTPYEVQSLMAQMVFDAGKMQACIDRNGYVTMNEPCSGAGGMVLAFAEVFRRHGFNSSTQLFVVTQDLDFTATNMTYIQLALCGLSALVERRNTLTMELYFNHYTPVYFLEQWPARFAANRIKDGIRRAI